MSLSKTRNQPNWQDNQVKRFGYLGTLFACLLISACSDKPTDINEQYQQRLATALDKPLPVTPPLNNLKLTPVHNNDNPATAQQLSIVQLAQLSHCKLNTLIAEHNSQLGKVASSAGQLTYQIQFIQLAPSCLEKLNSESKSYQAIKHELANKKQQLLKQFNHLLYNDPELKRTWQLTSYALDNNLAGLVETELALQNLLTLKQQIIQQQYTQIDSQALYPQLSQLRQFNFNQALVSAVRQQTYFNHSTSRYLTSIDLSALCNPLKNKRQAQIVSNVFKKYYLSQLQPYQAQLSGALERLMPLYQALWLDSTTNQPELRALLQQQPSNLLTAFKESAKTHVTWWQKFYKKCEISPI
ncbi:MULTISPECIES: DUF3080 family protein [Pseudoalteromonas]|uniref:DUF3080 family protein n=1 Tax=Pseudoalteromonas haloplanktis TaxID=228 RepID=A0ABU1BBS2_PSEHA|nr:MULTISPECIES: DUF3080 family protein [Pseudoalteromonas]MCF6142657.1 hypothetical protein [Pseudoalteromonas mariniglutinosa NCIMB 1770]MDQ9090959.1 DUF3080 family protein [Pseudoalteromonas haloplanktis]